ncbi:MULTISPECIES: GNAT family N-acetyltransferase [Subtercola]|uniref:GNAT family N-acetyltransferase n=1 Tax=Subtercola vilae TaxID=2056433 RepID=A0A4T2C929_9MICO|nr:MULTISPECIES: GNAT family N-acetyltransferase [Subtercola]MEA9986875.1 GNAT family N-acetyltransferase [Subtercola sp. RTI3]TIH38958.1 GNAT family N-acetyltransferase [Subtercola vilae]
MPVSYRQAGSDDADRLALVAAATFALACPPHTPAAGIQHFIVTNLSEEAFTGYLADDARMLFVAELDGLPVGYTMVVMGEPGDADVAAALTVRPTAELSKCYVVSGHHGLGIAAELMKVSVEAAAARGASGIWLGVNNENARANRFYEKNGFAVVGSKTFLVGTSLENDFVRERRL